MVQSLKRPEDSKRDLAALRIHREDTDEPRSKKPILYLLLATVLVGLAGAGLIAYRSVAASLNTAEVEVAHATVESSNAAYELLTATGYVVAHKKAAVGPKISGILDYEGVDVGSVVKGGQVLGRLEHHDLDAQIEDSKAALATAQASAAQAEAARATARATVAQAEATEHQTKLDFTRQTTLLKDGVAAKSDYDSAEAKEKVALAQIGQAMAQSSAADAQLHSAQSQIRSAEAKLKVLQAQLEYMNIRAPFDGIVISKDAEVGESVAPGTFGGNFTRGSVVTIVDPKTFEVEADVNESNITKVIEGLPAEITLDAIPDKKFRAEAYQVVPTADRQKATVKVKVRFLELDPRILPDMSAKVAFLQKTDSNAGPAQSRVTIPKSAVQQRDGKSVVAILQGDRVRLQPITTGQEFGDRVEVKEGLVGGETLVVHGGDTLADGARVKVKPGG